MDQTEDRRNVAPRCTDLLEAGLRSACSRPIRHLLTVFLIGCSLLCAKSGSAQLSQTVILGPVGSGPSEFGRTVVFLPNGNYVVSDPDYDLPEVVDVGAVHLYRGSDHALIATLTGSTAFDSVGISSGTPGITVLPSGHYLVNSPSWSPGGAVT